MASKVLILEDSKTQASIIARMIEAQGWETVHFDEVRPAMDAVNALKVDALFLDIFVGERNTLRHFDRFRLLAGNRPIALMTAGAKSEHIAETLKKARRAGADYVLRKPFSDTVVRDVLTHIGLAGSPKRRHVLIIDDSPTVRHFARVALDATRFRVSEAGSMEAAFADIDIAHVDLVLCDVFMPGMGGLQGMRMIKGTWPRVKIVSMSAGIETKVSSAEALNASRRIGVDAEISKPFSADDLNAILDALMVPPEPVRADAPAAQKAVLI